MDWNDPEIKAMIDDQKRKVNVTLREICDILKIEDKVPVFFINRDDIDIKKNNLIGFIGIPYEMCKDIDSGNYNSEKTYDKSQIGIYIPDIDISEFSVLKTSGNVQSSKDLRVKMIREFGMKKADWNLYYSVFCILHEVGHWKYYAHCCEDCKLSDEDIYLNEKKYRDPVDKYNKELFEFKETNGNSAKLDAMIRRHNNMYREIPSEQQADKYAFENLVDAINCVKKGLNKYAE